MADYDESLARVGVRIPDILIPKPGIDLRKWAVVACDQFTSQRDYWDRVDAYVGDAPSTLRLIFPEAFLADPRPERRIAEINETMAAYLERDLFETHPHTAFLVRRQTERGAARWGLMVALDLECYSWEADARTLIRATEGTILDRIPPRKVIRAEAPLELPHILVLISDEGRTVIEPLAARTAALTPVYSTDLMAGGGSVSAWAVDSAEDLSVLAEALSALHDALDEANPLLFAMGDGNHSFATAKSIWEDLKPGLPLTEWDGHPARYCLVELENIFDEGLEFEAIHRVLFGLSRSDFEAELARHCGSFRREPVAGLDAVLAAVAPSGEQAFGYNDADGFAVYTVHEPQASIAAGTLQRVIDALLAAGACEVDYIHGADVTARLGKTPDALGLFLAPIAKDTFFSSIVADGALPRKTFSMGEAEEKRYYMEARPIR